MRELTPSTRRPGARALVAAICFALLVVATLPASAAFERARQAAMGDVITLRNGLGSHANVAFRAMPAPAHQPREIPLPIGLVQLAVAPPVFDPDDPEFSPAAIADLLFNPPYDVRLMSPPDGEDAKIFMRIAEDEIVLDLGAAQTLIPADGFERGERFAADLFSSDVGAAMIQVTPLLTAHTRVRLSDDLSGALGEAIPLSSSGSYALDQTAEAQAALAIGLSYARQVTGEPAPDFGGAGDLERAGSGAPADELLDPDSRASIASTGESGLRVYAGGGVKFLLGLGYFATDGRLDLITKEPLLDPDDATDVAFEGTVRSALPTDGLAGQGFALDLGVGALYGREWEMGLGVTDLAGSMRWRGDTELLTLDQGSGVIRTTTIASGEHFTTHLTPQVVANVARHWGERQTTTVATDVRHSVDGTSWHVGAETHLSRFAFRGGTILDNERRLQGTGGAGVRLGQVGIDVSLATVSANSAGDRALMLGAALVLY